MMTLTRSVRMILLAPSHGRILLAPSHGSIRRILLALSSHGSVRKILLAQSSRGSVQRIVLAPSSQRRILLVLPQSRVRLLHALPQGSVRMLAPPYRYPPLPLGSLRGGCSSPSARRPRRRHYAMCCGARGSLTVWRTAFASTDSSPTRRQAGTQPSATKTLARRTWCLQPRRSKGAQAGGWRCGVVVFGRTIVLEYTRRCLVFEGTY